MKLHYLAVLLLSTQAIRIYDFIDNPDEEEDTRGGFEDEEMLDRIRVDSREI